MFEMDSVIHMFLSLIFILQGKPNTKANDVAEYLIRRTATYDEIQYNGNCNILNGVSTVRSGINWCSCINKLDVNNVKTTLYGSLLIFRNSQKKASIMCTYDYRKTGANFFLFPDYSAKFPVITAKDKDQRKYITYGANKFFATQYASTTRIFVKSLLVYDNVNQTYQNYTANIFKAQQIQIPNSDKVNWGLVLATASIGDVAGRMPQVILSGTTDQAALSGFTVVKFPGERKYKIDINVSPNPSLPVFTSGPAITTVKPSEVPIKPLPKQSSQNKEYKDLVYVLIAVTVILLLILVVMIFRIRKSNQAMKHYEKAILPKKYPPTEKQNHNPDSNSYEHLPAKSLIDEKYQSLARENDLSKRPQPPLPVVKTNSDFGYEINYNDGHESSVYTDVM